MIWIFKTSVQSQKQVKELSHFLNSTLGKDYWNFDLEDCDKILRLISDSQDKIELVMSHFKSKQLEISELE